MEFRLRAIVKGWGYHIASPWVGKGEAGEATKTGINYPTEAVTTFPYL